MPSLSVSLIVSDSKGYAYKWFLSMFYMEAVDKYYVQFVCAGIEMDLSQYKIEKGWFGSETKIKIPVDMTKGKLEKIVKGKFATEMQERRESLMAQTTN